MSASAQPAPRGATPRTLWVWDLDRTLFNTDQFMSDLMDVLGTLPASTHATDLKEQAANTELFDPFGFLAQRNLSHGKIAQRFTAFIRTTRGPEYSYLYSDVVGAVAQVGAVPGIHQVIFTTGTRETQRFKLELSLALAALPQAVTEGNKGEILEARFGPDGRISYDGQVFDRLVLCDDKASSLTPIKQRPTFRGIHVQRPGTRYTQKTGRPDDIYEVVDVRNLPALLSHWL
jgi:hypothetical protein